MTPLQSLVPLTLWPESAFPIKHKWILVEGVSLIPLNGVLKGQIETYTKTLPFLARSDHNYALVVEHDRFITAVSKRLNGHSLSDSEHLSPHQLARAFLLAAVLIHPITFRLGIVFSGRPLLRSSGFCPMSSTNYDEEQIYLYRRLGMSRDRQPMIFTTQVLKAKMFNIERYFITANPTLDRVGAAIAHLWSSLCTPYKEQALLSVCAGLETLTSTGDKAEITHQISERLAFLIGKDPRHRLHIYRETKYVYAMRSNIIHGTYFQKRKQDETWNDALMITPTYFFAGDRALRKGTVLLCEVLNRFLSESALVHACAEKEHNPAMRNYFETLIF